MKNKRVRRLTDVDLSDELNVLTVKTLSRLKKLQGPKDWLLDTPNEVFLLNGALAFRFIKPSAKPRIMPCTSIEVNPDSAGVKVTLSVHDLMSFAVQEKLLVFETQKEFTIPGAFTLTAQKNETGTRSLAT